jgi:hypothetical protein
VKPGIAAREEVPQHNTDDGKKRSSGNGGNENALLNEDGEPV